MNPPHPFQQPFNGRFSPFQSRTTGFQSSVLFPGDIQHPLAADNRNQDSSPPASYGDDGVLPNSPPINMKEFDFDSMDTCHPEN